MQDYIRTLRMLNSTGTSYLDNISYMYYLYDSLGRLTLQGEYTGKNPSSSPTVLVQSYYDGYGFVGGTGLPTGQFTKDTSGYGRGSLTGSAVTVFGSSTKIYKAFYYDIKGRMTKSVQNNLLSGYDITSTVYTFSDKPSGVTHTHTASGKTTRTEVYTYTYDHADRISKVQHSLGGTSITLYDATYDNFGRLLTKQYHGTSINKLTYAYNLRSWLTGISGKCFTQNVYYNTGVGTAKYNGNISSMTWKSGNESTVRGYKFTYDGLSRLMNATYGETAGINTNTNRFSENVTAYDKNGNIKTLQRYGQTAASSYGLIDNLTFTLAGNQLSRVDDAAAASAYNGGFEFKDGVKQANEYTYDSNGNLTKDLNKGISTITYNVLNLPNMVTFSDGSTIAYTYGADGTKLKTVHKTGSTTTTTDYCGNVVYENGVQKLLLTDEGYVTLSDSKYHYYLKDHQGNNRVVINQSGTVEETNHYYPFGGVFASSGNVQPYKYNGKELDAKKGLNWYDYGARHYDAALGRFTTVDPSAENYYSTSPFTYCLNNPLNYIDPLGTDTVDVKDVDWNKFDPKKDVVALDEVAVSVPNALTKVGTRALEPISGFWGYVGYYLLDIGSTYHSEQTRFTYKVGTDGVITGVAPMVGTPPLPGFAKTSNLNTIRGLWSLTKQGSSKVMKHPIRGLFYKSKSDGLWWVKDQTKHGGSFYKVYKETNKGLEWHKDADKYGNFIINKHKSDVGIFIPWKELSK